MTEIPPPVKKLKELIDQSSKVLITSHISPDPDAVSSLLLLGRTLKHNLPEKQINMVLEEEPLGLEFLDGYKAIEFRNLSEAIAEHKPNLFILLDANNYDRASRLQGGQIRQYLKDNEVKTVVIDHHEPEGSDTTDVYINQKSPAVAQDVYEILFKYLDLQKPESAAQTAMLGIYADSGGFIYENPRHSDTFKLIDELVSDGADIEKIANQINIYSESDIRVLAELATNLSHDNDFNFSFISDAFVAEWLAGGKDATQLHKGTEAFVNHFLRNIENRKWGFIVYKNVLQGENIYSASFRSMGNVRDVSQIAAKLGGGGHKPAAGAKFEASNVNEAIGKVKRAIEEVS